MPGSAPNPNWQTISLGATPANYNGFLLNGPAGSNPPGTGGKRLSLPLTAPGVGGTNVDIIRRPPAGENVLGILYNERLVNQAEHPHSALRQLRGHHQHAGYRAGCADSA